MKFLYLRTRFRFNLKAGGSVGHTSGVINALAEKHEVQVFTNDHLPNVNIETHYIAPKVIKWLPTNLNVLLYNLKVISQVKSQVKGKIIYKRHSANSFLGAYLARKYKVPLILEFNSSEVWMLKNWEKQHNTRTPKGFFLNIYKYLIELPIVSIVEKYNTSTAKVIIVVSDELKRVLIEMGVSPNKVVVYPNGIDPTHYNPTIDGTTIKKQLNISNKKVIGFIGSFGQWHGVVELAKAIIKFFDKYPNLNNKISFLLIGNGLLYPKVAELINASKYKANVILTGTIPQEIAPQYLAACDILVSPHVPNADGTKFFGSPTKLFEYMAMGKGIIASDLEQIGEILKHEETALLVTPKDIEALADAMFRLINDDELNAKLGKNAVLEALKKYTWNIHVDQILNQLALQINPE